MSQRAFKSRGGKRRWPVECPRCEAPVGRACIPDGKVPAISCPDHAARKRAIAEHREAQADA